MTSVVQPLAAERIAPAPAGRAETRRSALDAALYESRWFLRAVGAQLVASAIICGIAHRPLLAGPFDAYTTFLSAALLFGTMALVAELFRRRLLEPRSLTPFAAYSRAWSALRRELLTPEYVATVLLTFAVVPICISAFSAAKQAIPVLHPFTWDAYLSRWGSFVDGGRPMWQRLQPMLGKPEITTSLDWFYHRAWTALLMAAFVWTALMRPSHVRRRFLFAFVALFLVVGNIFALALASAGPAYYDLVTSGGLHPYTNLLSYLHAVDARSPLLSVRGEGALWYAYSHGVKGLGLGVSAMPSMHVASAVLVAFFGFAFSRMLGVLLVVVALCTFAASIALGWHYALDGYVGALLAGAVWWIAGRLTRHGAA